MMRCKIGKPSMDQLERDAITSQQHGSRFVVVFNRAMDSISMCIGTRFGQSQCQGNSRVWRMT